MGYSNVLTPLIAKGLKLLALAVPLAMVALLTLTTVQAYNDMAAQANNNMNDVELASRLEFEKGSLPRTALPGG